MDAWSFVDTSVAIARSNVKSQPATLRAAPEAQGPRPTSLWDQLQRSPAKKGGGAWPTTSSSSSSSQHCLLSEVSYKPLPRALQREQSHAQSVSSTQVIPELNALAITVDTKLYLWFYGQHVDGDGDGDAVAAPAAEFPGLVLSLALTTPKASVVSQPAFKELVVPYVLVVSTTEGVYLHLVCRNTPLPYTLLPSPFFFPTPRSNPMIRVAGSSSGAIFCASADGYLYSLTYNMEQQRSSLLAVWPAGSGGLLPLPSQNLVKHKPALSAASAQPSLVGQLFSFAAPAAAEDPSLSLLHGDVADLVVDDTRGIVYVLYSRGVLGFLHFQAAGAAAFSLVDLGKALGEAGAVHAVRVFPLSPCEVDTASHGFVLLGSGVRVDFQSSAGPGAGMAVCGVSSCLEQQRQAGQGEAAGSVAAYCMGSLVTAGLDRTVCGSRGAAGASVVALRADALSIRADCLVKDDVASSRLLSAALAPEASLSSLLLPHVDFLLPAAGIDGASDGGAHGLRGSKGFTAVSSVALKQLPFPASASFVVGSRAGVHLLSLEASEYRSDEELASALVASLCDPTNSASSMEGHFEALCSALRPGAGSQALVAVSPSPVRRPGPQQSPYKLVLARQASRTAPQSVLINGLQVDLPEKLPVAAGAALYQAHLLLPLWSTPLVSAGGWTPCFENNAQACGPVLAALETLQDLLLRLLEAAAPSSHADEQQGSGAMEDLSAVLRLASRALAVLRLLQEATFAVPQAVAVAAHLSLLQGHTLSSLLADPSLLRRFLHAAVAAVSQGHASYGPGAEDDDGEALALASSLLRVSDRHAPAVSSDLWSAVDLWEAAGLVLLHDLARLAGGQLSEDDVFHVERNLLPAAETPGGWSVRTESRSIVLRHPDKTLANVCGLLRDLATKASSAGAWGVVRAAHQAIVHICTAAAESLSLAFPGTDAARFAYEAMLDAMPPFESSGAGAGAGDRDGATEMSSPDTTELLSMLQYMLRLQPSSSSSSSPSYSPTGSPGGGLPSRPVPLAEVCRYYFARRPQVLTSAPLLSTDTRDCLLDMLRVAHAEAAAAGGSRELDAVLRVLFTFLMSLGDHHSLVLCIQVLSQCTHVDAQPRLINQAHIERLEFMLLATDRLLRIEGCSAEDCQAVCLGWILGRVQLELTSKLDAPGLHELGAVLGRQLLSASEWFDPGPRCVARALASLTEYPGVAVLLLRAVEAVEATSSSNNTNSITSNGSGGSGCGTGSSGFTREERRALWRSAIDSGCAEDALEDLLRIEQWRARSVAASASSSSSASSAQGQAQAQLVGVSIYMLERLFDAEQQQYSGSNNNDGDEDGDEAEPDACQVLYSLGFSRTDVLVAGMGILTSLHASRGLKPLGLEFQLSANQLEMLLSLLVRLLHDWVSRAHQDSLQGSMPQDVILLSHTRALDSFVENVRFFLGEGAAGAEEEQRLFAEVVQTISLLWR